MAVREGSRSAEGRRLVVEPELLTTWSSTEMNVVFERQLPYSPPLGYRYLPRSAELPSRKQLLRQIETARSLESFLLPNIADELNQLHQVALPERSWKILVGHWLRALCENIVRRESDLSTLNHTGMPLSISGFPLANDLVPGTTADGTSIMNGSRWSHFVYSNIFENMGLGSVVSVAPEKCRNANQIEISDFHSRLGSTGISVGEPTLAASYSSLRSRLFDRAGVLSSTYMSRKSQLQVLVLNFPRTILLRSLSPDSEESSPDFGLRISLSETKFGMAHPPRAGLVWRLFWLLCPKSFIEDFENLVAWLQKSSVPANPRFVLTGNSFDGANDLMRIYLALVTSRGTKYIVNQHGNLYGTSIFRSPSIEEVTSDTFITWGWSNKENPVRYEALGRSRSLPRRRNADRSGALFVLDTPTTPAGILDPDLWNREIFTRQTASIGLLPEDLLLNSKLRFHAAQPHRWPDQRSKWASEFPQLAQDFGVSPIRKLIRRHQVTIFLYDSTGFLEALPSRHPTLCFLPEGLDHIANDSLADFEGMVAEGLILTEVDGLAKFFDEHWHEIDEWWLRTQKQKIVAEFSSKYSRLSTSFGRDVRRLILEG